MNIKSTLLVIALAAATLCADNHSPDTLSGHYEVRAGQRDIIEKTLLGTMGVVWIVALPPMIKFLVVEQTGDPEEMILDTKTGLTRKSTRWERAQRRFPLVCDTITQMTISTLGFYLISKPSPEFFWVSHAKAIVNSQSQSTL